MSQVIIKNAIKFLWINHQTSPEVILLVVMGNREEADN